MTTAGPLEANDLAAFSIAPLAPAEQGVAFAVGVVFMILGLYLRWRLPHERMAVEEYAKERKLTEQQARYRVQLVRFGGPLAVILGLAAFAMVFVE